MGSNGDPRYDPSYRPLVQSRWIQITALWRGKDTRDGRVVYHGRVSKDFQVFVVEQNQYGNPRAPVFRLYFAPGPIENDQDQVLYGADEAERADRAPLPQHQRGPEIPPTVLVNRAPERGVDVSQHVVERQGPPRPPHMLSALQLAQREAQYERPKDPKDRF